MHQLTYLFGLSVLATILIACTGTGGMALDAISRAQPPPASPTVIPPPTPIPLTQAAIAACPVSLPNVGTSSPSRHFVSPYDYGNGALWATLGIGGKIIPAPEQWGEDGSLDWKMGWYRGVRGKLTVTGRRLDASALPAQGHYDIEGYGDIGFQAGGIHFPSEGCWEITGRVGEASLTFVTLVIRVPFEAARAAGVPEGLSFRDWDVTSLPQSIRLIYGSPILGKGQVTWSYGELSIETTQGVWENLNLYPEAAQRPVTVKEQPGICIQGDWDTHGQWQAEADVEVLEWTAAGFSYRIRQVGLGLSCEDLLRITGSPS